MSGQATGWVLRHGPTDRAMRAVLVTIADAANRDGRHAHPGIAAMVEGSLYSRATVQRVLAQLVRDGWLEVEEQGGGRGVATVYRVVMGQKPPHDETVSADKPPHLSRQTASPEPKPPHGNAVTSTDATPTVSTTEKINGAGARAGAGGRPSGPPSPDGRDAPAEVEAWGFDRDLIGKARGVLRGER